MFITRLLSGIVLVLLAAVLLFTGSEILLAALCIISIIGLIELYRVGGIHNTILGITGFIGATAYYLLIFLLGSQKDITMMYAMGILIVFMGIYVFNFPRFKIQEITLAFFGVFYVPVMLSYIYYLRELSGVLVILIFIASWGCDTCAYCVGMLIGKHKLSPVLSPKKSIEGAVGGAIGAALLGALAAFLLRDQITSLSSPVLEAALICLAGAVISQIGDLAASAIKRNYNIKDYGNLIPGHGGILDRFDSVIFVAPVIYYVTRILVG